MNAAFTAYQCEDLNPIVRVGLLVCKFYHKFTVPPTKL